jgi:choice-of-anchor C domain-containing protein
MRTSLMASIATAVLLLTLITLRTGRAEDDPPGDLIVNGSFEEGPEFEGGYRSLDQGSDVIKGWVVTRSQIDYTGTHWRAATGARSIDLNGSPGFGGIKQSFATTKGRKYKVRFAMAGTPIAYGGDGGVKILCVRAAGKKEAFSADATDKTGDDMGWTKKTWEFTATAENTTLEFYSLDYDDPNCGPALDDVSVVEVKEKDGK